MSSSIITPTSRSLFLDPGPLRPLVAESGRCLASQGHTVLTVRGYEDAARHFAAWFQQTGTAVADIGEDTCVAFAAHRCRCPGGRRANRVSAKYARRAWRFVQFISTFRAAGPTTTSELTPRIPEWDCSKTGSVGTAEYQSAPSTGMAAWSCGCWPLWVLIPLGTWRA